MIGGGCWTIDDGKMGNTYIRENEANTLAARDYKMPQTVVYWDGSQTVGTLTANNAGGGSEDARQRELQLYHHIYPKVTGTIMANSHPGSYCGQDAYNDMFVICVKK